MRFDNGGSCAESDHRGAPKIEMNNCLCIDESSNSAPVAETHLRINAYLDYLFPVAASLLPTTSAFNCHKGFKQIATADGISLAPHLRSLDLRFDKLDDKPFTFLRRFPFGGSNGNTVRVQFLIPWLPPQL